MGEAGSTSPGPAFYTSRAGISTGLVTCSICHDPHVDKITKPKLLRGTTTDDFICKQCHTTFLSNFADARLSHPLVANYLTFAAANPTRFVSATDVGGGKLSTNVGNGMVSLVSGGISCTTCHGTHYSDSSAVTVDNKGNYLSGVLKPGDGNLLRADGPMRTGGATRGTAVTGTAQLRSNLCQACHKYKMHGASGGTYTIGCLDCHGGHSYNNGIPSDFVLADRSPDAVPIRLNLAYSGTAIVDYPNFLAATPSRLSWSDDVVGGANPGFCEKCHGDVQAGAVGAADTAHLAGASTQCSDCHKHDDLLYSFAKDANASTCGKCHGFPPYLNISGYRASVGDPNDGGWASNQVDAPFYDYVGSTTYEKNETQTGHKTHAGAALALNATAKPTGGGGEYYFVGNSGIKNCQPCHGINAGETAGGHRQPIATYPNTFRDVSFNSAATANGLLVPVYNPATWVCTNTYCHSNGGKRDPDGIKEALDFKVVASPAWVGTGANGYGSIFNLPGATRCSACHGNTPATMLLAQKDGSPVHNAHLGSGSMATISKYGCEVCHAKTASSAISLAPSANDARDASVAVGGGRHVNDTVDIDYKGSGSTLYTALAGNTFGSRYDQPSGTCSIYCHDPDDTGLTADWDTLGTLQCDSCHGGLSTDIAPGFGPIATGTHPRHVTALDGPRLACSVCHGTNDGKHATHLNGVDDFTPSTVCATCHGWTAGETVLVWTNPASSKCETCHSNTVTPVGAWAGLATEAPNKSTALTTGHGKTSGTYLDKGTPNNAANRGCAECHDLNAAGHFDGTSGDDKRLVLGSSGFPAAYTTVADKNNHCFACHGAAPGHVPAATKTALVTHQAKACIACHDPHGNTNRYMILSSAVTQNAKDTTATGKYTAAATIAFTAFTLTDSYDEVGAAAGANNDDLCATCHTAAAATSHNNRDGTGTHSDASTHEGEDCLTSCHKAHTDAAPFAFGAGTACNGCHGNPPATGAHRAGVTVSDAELHSTTGSNDISELRTDCELCHTGSASYTYDYAADQAAGGARGNHNKGADAAAVRANRQAVLLTSVGYVAAGGTCGASGVYRCHNATAPDAWATTDGLSCNACHYSVTGMPTAAGNVTSGNSEQVTPQSHTKHFDKAAITCVTCHTVDNGGVALRGPLLHINDKSGATEALKFQGMAAALPDEAAIDFTGSTTRYTWTDLPNTCGSATNFGLACHASGTPDWDVAIPATSTGCVMCHTGTSVTQVDPTSSLHAVVPTVTGKQHAGSFTYNAGANTADCLTCHTATPTITASDHINGTFNASIGSVAAPQKITLVAALTYVDGVVPTCNVSTVGCHTAKTAPQSRSWLYKWHNNGAATNGTQCDGCHGMWTAWNGGVIAHRSGSEAETYHGTGATYKCRDCHGLESASGYLFSTTNNDWRPNAGELGTTLHGDGVVNVNTNGGATFSRTPYSGCTAACHLNTDGIAAGQHGFEVTTWGYTTITGDAIVSNCYSCHGGATVGVSTSNYWPDGANTINDNATPDNIGEHLTHITQLAAKVMGQNITQLLTNNVGVGNAPWNTATADAKQLELCLYCHRTPIGNDADHKTAGPAELTTAGGGFLNLWDKAADNGVYTTATGSCATTNCHNNVTTTAGYYWYAGGTSTCATCHTTGAADAPHVAHLAAAVGTMTCLPCHGAGTTTTAAPTAGHINGTFTVVGTLIGTAVNGTTVNYSGGLNGTCGTVNACHTTGVYNGTVLAPPIATGTTFIWGTTVIAGTCVACHDITTALASGSHLPHLQTTSQSGAGAITCNSCHTAATVATHMDQAINFTGAATNYGTESIFNTTYLGNCGTNVCHNSGRTVATVLQPPYNNGLGSYAWNNSAIGVGTNTCTECHANTGATLTSDAHDTHLTAPAGIFSGPAITCSSCHTAATLASHVDQTINITGMTYGGDVLISGTTFGSCGTNACHKDGKGGPPADTVYDWNTTKADCSICHLAKPTTGSHNTHLTAVAWGPYPAGTTVCDMCHLANNNNTTMAAKTTHMNNTISFNGPNEVATGAMATDTLVSACNACHGNLTASNVAGGAKKSWATAARLACETCHGNYSDAVILTKTAPHTAGTTTGQYTLAGHGKAGIARACSACHLNTLAGHIDGITGDDKRLITVNAQTYGARYAAASINYCGLACHATSMKLHYTNGASGTSFPADSTMDCLTCHNPHGQTLDATSNALATMIRPTIDGKLIVGFYNKATQSNYYEVTPNNASNNRYGICQACHAPTDASASGGTVDNFNRTTSLPGHQGGGNCITCHVHTDTPAFKFSGGSGCNGCHGYPPVQQLTIGTAGYPYNSGANLGKAKVEDYNGGGRAHAVLAHINPATLPDPALNLWWPCEPCHAFVEGGHKMSYGVGNLNNTTRPTFAGNTDDTALTGRYPRVNISATYDKGIPAKYIMGNPGTAADGMGYCTNTSCHFGDSPKWDCDPVIKTNDPL